MSEQMRKALEAVQGDMDEIGHLSASTCRKIDDALKSEPTIAELVAELRKRDGVDVFEIGDNEEYYLDKFPAGHPEDDVNLACDSGKATIIRITE